MVHYPRNFVPGGTFFFTVTLDDRSSSALVDHIALLRSAFRTTQSERPFVTDAIVILPDHLHAILTLPPGDSDFSDRWRRIKGSFTRSGVATGASISRDHRGEYSLWQKRFWEHTIRDERDFERCANYVHFNPVKHQLATSPSDWPFSSLHRYVRAGILPPDWGGGGPLIRSISVSGKTDPDCAALHPGYRSCSRDRRRARHRNRDCSVSMPPYGSSQ
jgi:putative transposase